MVLESFSSPVKAYKKPWTLLFVGALYATVAVFLSVWIFKQYSSLVMVFLTVIASVPLMYRTLKMEERASVTLKTEGKILKEHSRVLEYLLFLFAGFIVAYVLWFVLMPAKVVEVLFATQIETITAINSRIVGGTVSSSSIFMQVFLNNVKVLMFSLFFSFFYGAGAIFILTWNASVIAAAIGNFIKDKVAEYLASIGAVNMFNYFHIFSLGFLRYSLHGIPEIAAYFVGGLAGGIISVGMINHDLESKRFKNIIVDALDLSLLAIFILFVAGLIEVFITPLFF
jgi:uncharacterized membrane protein SpoIIM required for sporulation